MKLCIAITSSTVTLTVILLNNIRKKTERRRDSSNEDKLSGMSVTNFEWLDSELILNEFSGRKATHLGQVIVIDSGCPRSLMGEDELSKLMNKLEVEVFTVKEESFRFGLSRIYTSNRN